MAYTKYSLTPADNNAAPPNGAPEGMLPSAVNDTMRDMMSQIRDVGDGIRGGTYTMTAPVITGGSITGVALSGNTLTNPVITGGSINNTTVGATTRSTGAFTTLASNGATTFTAGTASTSTTTGTAVITGGLGVSGRINAANFDGIVGANTAAAGNFTTLGATGVVTFSAGTVSAPAITTTGDTNTGIFFPTADTIAFTEGGVEAMRIFSNGRVGIGASTDLSAGFLTVQNGSGTYTAAFVNSLAFSTLPAASLAFSGKYNTAGDITVFGSVVAGKENATDGNRAGYLRFSSATVSGETERMRIDSAGNVGIGTSTINAKVQVSLGDVMPAASGNMNSGVVFQGGSGSQALNFGTSVTNNLCWINSAYANSSNSSGPSLAFMTGATERMRLDASGNLGLGVTPSAWGATYKALDINTVGGIASTTGGLRILANAYFSGSAWTYKTTAEATRYDQVTGQHQWYNAPSGTAGNTITFTQAMTLDASGNLLVGITSARANAGDVQVSKGISFPATQSASSNANTLDDYEEGTWTPTITFGGASVGVTYFSPYRLCSYTKVGRLVTVTGILWLTNKGSSTGTAQITGLPFTTANSDAAFTGFYPYLESVTYSGTPQIRVASNATALEFTQITDAGTVSVLTDSNFSNSSQVRFSFSYIAA